MKPLSRIACLCAAFVVSTLTPLQSASAASGSWSSTFSNGLADWNNPRPWGGENLSVIPENEINGNALRVRIHKGGIDPATMRARGHAVSGSGFKAKVIERGSDHASLSYKVRFPTGFDFVRGGKLPGLYGGAGNSGGHIPDGEDGFSFRLMWLKDGKGRVYAYLPSSRVFGTPLLEGRFQFATGKWHQVTEELTLNTVGDSDGMVRVWIDGKFVGEVSGLTIRSVPELRIDGVFFDVFFGGNDDTWAASESTFIDFSEFKVRWW